MLGLRSIIRACITLVIVSTVAAVVIKSNANANEELSRPAILVRQQSGDIGWMNHNAAMMDSSLALDLLTQIPPIVKGFSEADNPEADKVLNLERIAVYKELERQLNRGSSPYWNNIDEINLAEPKGVILRLAQPPITVQVGNSQFHVRLNMALEILKELSEGDSLFFRNLNVQNPDGLFKNLNNIDFMDIDVSQPEKILLNFYMPENDNPSDKPKE